MPCQKIPFESRNAAVTFSREVDVQRKFRSKKAANIQKANRKQFPYHCGFCGNWHLSTTKHPPKRRAR